MHQMSRSHCPTMRRRHDASNGRLLPTQRLYFWFILLSLPFGVHGKRSPIREKEKTLLSQQRDLIIGGRPAAVGDYPYFVHFRSLGCGGALIAPDLVLTAAHCRGNTLSEYGRAHVGKHLRAGSDNSEFFSVVAETIHPGFDNQVCCGRSGNDLFYGVHNDFMLLKLSGQAKVSLIRLNTNALQPGSGDELHVIGFGDIRPGSRFEEPDQLQEATVNYMTNRECIQNSIYPSRLLITTSMCAADKRKQQDACAGDSGGPLIVKGGASADDVLVGVVSWGWDCAVEPGVYGRVSEVYQWIRSETCRLSDNPPASFGCPNSKSNLTLQPTVSPTERPTNSPSPPPSESPTDQPTLSPTPLPTISPSRSPSSGPSLGLTKGPTMVPTTAPTQEPSANLPSGRPTETLSEIPTVHPTDDSTTGHTTLPTREKSTFPPAYPSAEPSAEVAASPVAEPSMSPPAEATELSSTIPTENSSSNLILPETITLTNTSSLYPSAAPNFSETFSPTNGTELEDLFGDRNETQGIDNTDTVILEDKNTSWYMDIDFDQPGKQIQRSLLPPGRPCSSASASPDVCCSSISNRQDASLGDDCIPAPSGTAFKGGLPCESAAWVKTNDPATFRFDICSMFSNQNMIASTNDGKERSETDRPSQLFERRRFLPPGMSCANVTTRNDCCNFFDNRDDHESVFHGQPCVAIRDFRDHETISDTICHPANFIANFAPARALDCAEVARLDSDEMKAWNGYMAQFLEELQEAITLDRQGAVLDRAQLPSNKKCQYIRDPLVCCASRHVTDGDCAPLSVSLGRSESHATCHPSGDDNVTISYLEADFEVSAEGTISPTSILSATEGVGREDFCNEVVKANTGRRSRTTECSTLKNPQSCCSALDASGQACVPLEGKGCAAIQWVVANVEDVIVVDCADYV